MTSAVETPPSNRGRWGPSQGCLMQPNGGRDCWAPRRRSGLGPALWRVYTLPGCSLWGLGSVGAETVSCEESLRTKQAEQGLWEKAGWGACGLGRSGEKCPGSPLVCLGFDPRALAPQCLPWAEGAPWTDSHLWIVCSTISREGTFFCWI